MTAGMWHALGEDILVQSFIRKPEGIKYLEDLGLDGRVLRWIYLLFNKYL
jgi:hypothetical protein